VLSNVGVVLLQRSSSADIRVYLCCPRLTHVQTMFRLLVSSRGRGCIPVLASAPCPPPVMRAPLADHRGRHHPTASFFTSNLLAGWNASLDASLLCYLGNTHHQPASSGPHSQSSVRNNSTLSCARQSPAVAEFDIRDSKVTLLSLHSCYLTDCHYQTA